MSELDTTISELLANALNEDPTANASHLRQGFGELLAAVHNAVSDGVDVSHLTRSTNDLLAGIHNAISEGAQVSHLTHSPAQILEAIANAEGASLSRLSTSTSALWSEAVSMMVQSGRFGGGGGPATDPYFAYTRLLLGFDTDYADESAAANGAPNPVAGVSRTTSSPLMGTHSLAIDGGSSSSLRWADGASWSLGSDRVCLEVLASFAGAGVTDAEFVHQWNTNGSQAWWFGLSGGNLAWVIRNAADNNDYTILSGAFAPAQNAPYHLCYEREGNTHFLYAAGSVIATTTDSKAVKDGSAELRIGARDGGGTIASFNGKMDEIRLTVGHTAARYNGAFTPPTSAFPRS